MTPVQDLYLKGCALPIVGIVALIAVIWYNWEWLNTSKSTPPWRSAEQCVEDHIRAAEGSYPLAGDNIADLRIFCERVYNDKHYCDFGCLLTSVGWEFALRGGPPSSRSVRLSAYFRRRS